MKLNKRALFKEILSYGLVIVLIIFIKMFIFSPIKVSGTSMDDTLKHNDVMILNEFIYRFVDVKRDDIVVLAEDKELIIKRIIGLPNEIIECSDGVIYINGKVYDDKYASNATEDFKEVKLGEDEYFVLGDNRGVSLDSRTFGAFKKSDIKGKANLTIYPFNRFGNKE